MNRHCEPIPEDFPVQPLTTQEQIESAGCIATYGHCGNSWDDSRQTEWTPAPFARCPFEHFHVYEGSDTGFYHKIEIDLDFHLLRKQKEELVRLVLSSKSGLSGEQKELLDGIVGLLDHIQDQIVDTDQATSLEVFGFES